MSPRDTGDPSLGLSSYGPQFPIVKEAVTHMACRRPMEGQRMCDQLVRGGSGSGSSHFLGIYVPGTR